MGLTKLRAGAFPAGTCVQTAHATGTDFAGGVAGLTPNNTEVKILEKAITLKTKNPYLLVTVTIGIGAPDSYRDIDMALALGYKASSATTDPNDYSQFGGNVYQREGVTNLKSFFAADTMGAHSSGAQYWCETKSWQMYKQVTANAGTVIYMACWCSTNGQYFPAKIENGKIKNYH